MQIRRDIDSVLWNRIENLISKRIRNRLNYTPSNRMTQIYYIILKLLLIGVFFPLTLIETCLFFSPHFDLNNSLRNYMETLNFNSFVRFVNSQYIANKHLNVRTKCQFLTCHLAIIKKVSAEMVREFAKFDTNNTFVSMWYFEIFPRTSGHNVSRFRPHPCNFPPPPCT